MNYRIITAMAKRIKTMECVKMHSITETDIRIIIMAHAMVRRIELVNMNMPTRKLSTDDNDMVDFVGDVCQYMRMMIDGNIATPFQCVDKKIKTISCPNHGGILYGGY